MQCVLENVKDFIGKVNIEGPFIHQHSAGSINEVSAAIVPCPCIKICSAISCLHDSAWPEPNATQ